MGLIEMQQQYLSLRRDLAEQEDSLKKARKKASELEQLLAEQMKALGQTSTVLEGKRLTVRSTPRIGKKGDVPMEILCTTLAGTPWSFLVKDSVHPQSLQATMKEVVEENGQLPPELEPLLRCWEQVSVAVTSTP